MMLLRWCVVILALFTLTGGLGMGAASRTASAQTGAGYDLTWNTLESGIIVESTGGDYTLNGVFGQTEAGPALEGGVYRLEGGFWTGAIAQQLYLPLVMRK